MNATASLWRTESSLQELVLCFHHVGSGDWTQVMSLGSEPSSCSSMFLHFMVPWESMANGALLSSVFCLHWVNGGPVLGTQDLPGVCGFPAVSEAIVLLFLHWMILASMSQTIRDMSLVLRSHLCFSSVLTCLSFLVSTTSVDYHCFIASLNIYKCESSDSSKSTLTYFGSLTIPSI